MLECQSFNVRGGCVCVVHHECVGRSQDDSSPWYCADCSERKEQARLNRELRRTERIERTNARIGGIDGVNISMDSVEYDPLSHRNRRSDENVARLNQILSSDRVETTMMPQSGEQKCSHEIDTLVRLSWEDLKRYLLYFNHISQ